MFRGRDNILIINFALMWNRTDPYLDTTTLVSRRCSLRTIQQTQENNKFGEL